MAISWKQPKCPSTEKWIKVCGGWMNKIDGMECCLAIREDVLYVHKTT